MKPHPPTDPAALRRAAEAQVKQRRATKPPLTKADLNRLQHELEVHQVELELQNENLLASQAELQTALGRYTELFEFAPVGYLTLGPDGEIRQLNLTAATLLGAERSRLVNRRLGLFVGLADLAALAAFLERVFLSQYSEACEVTLSESSVVVRIEAVNAPSGQECRAVLTDITELKQAEVALRERFKEFACLYSITTLMASPGALLEETLDETVRLIPPGWQFPEVAAARLVVGGRTFQTSHFREATARQACQVLVEGRPVGQLEVCYLEERPASHEGPFLAEERALLNAIAERVGFLVEHKQAEAALRESEEKYRVLVETTNTGFLILNNEGKVIDANEEYVRLTGHSELGDIIGKTVIEWTADYDQQRNAAAVAQCIKVGFVKNFVTDYVDGNGRITPIEVNAAIIRTDESMRIVSLCRDITERKRAEEALRQSEARLKRAQQVAGLGNWEWNLITKQLDWAEENYRLHGLDPQKVKPSYEAFLQAIVPEEHEFVNKTVAAALAGKASCEFDYTVIRPDNGQRCVIHSKAEVIVDDAGQAVKMVGTVQDITERKRLEARLRQAQKMEAIGRLTGGVAHEFNNILAAIMTGLELTKLSGSWGEDRELLGVMEGSCHRAAGLVKQLLASSSQSVMRPQSLDLAATVAKELEGLRPLLGEGITLEFNRPPSVSRVWADKALVKEMVRGLCRNAQEAMPSGGVLRVELGEEEVGAERGKSHLDARAGRFVRLVVGDTGCGMDEQTLKRLFEPFFTTKDIVHGSGLSLAAAQGIVRQHQGWVEVESRVGQGSTFRVYLPVEVRKGDRTVLARPVTPALGSRGLILLAEDDESLRQLTQKFLVRLGYQVLEAADGAEALAVWAAHEAEIDLIFTDMVMPGELSGLDVVQQAMAKKPGVKAIITSGYNTEKPDLKAARTSGILYLPKPWVFKELVEILRVMLGSGVAPASQANAARI
jgi:PAS domain S-box-containing protein